MSKRAQGPGPNTNSGYCECGCGECAPIARRTNPQLGHVRGKPTRFKLGHYQRSVSEVDREQYRHDWAEQAAGVPYGYCWCECGLRTNIAPQSSLAAGYIQGEPYRYLSNHHTKPSREGVEISAIIAEFGSEIARATGYVAIPLNAGRITLVDEADADAVLHHTWCTHKPVPNCYAVARIDGVQVRLHRLITGAHEDQDVDHINYHGLDNRRSNLRLCTRQENSARRRAPQPSNTGYRGAYRRSAKDGGGFAARLMAHGHSIALGTYDTAKEAARAYDLKAFELYGEFAVLNKPPNVADTRPRLRGQQLRCLADWQVRAMRRAREEANLTYIQLGESFGVHRVTARRICERQAYKDIN